MSQLFSNNGSALLSQDLLSGDVLVVVGASLGGRFPLPISATDFFIAVLDNGAGQLEVIKCTLRNGDSMVVQRGQEGTTAQDFLIGDRVGCRMSAGTMASFMDPADPLFNGPVDLNSNALINGEILSVPIRGTAGDASNEIVVPPASARPTIGGVDILLITDSPLGNGTIFMWSGNPLALPTSWRLCDGTNGAPDLSSRFIVSYKVSDPAFGNIHGVGGNATDTDPAGVHNHGGLAITNILTQANIPTLTLRAHLGISNANSDTHDKLDQIAAGRAGTPTHADSNIPVDYINVAPTGHDHDITNEVDHTHSMVPAYYTLAYIQFGGVAIPPIFTGSFAGQTYDEFETISVDMTLEFNEGNGTNQTYTATGLPPGLSIVATGGGRGVITGTISGCAVDNAPYSPQVTLTTGNLPPAVSDAPVWSITPIPLAPAGTFSAVVTPLDIVASCTIDGYGGAFDVSWDGGNTFTPYVFGNPTVATQVPTGHILIRSSDAGFNRVRFVTDTFCAIDIQQSSTLTSANAMCSNLSQLTSFQMPGANLITDFSSAWLNCTGLTSFPLIDTSSATNLSTTWDGCAGLTSFSLIDTSSVNNFLATWRDCAGLVTFPLIDVSSTPDLNGTWKNCSGLTSFPLIDTSLVTTLPSTWDGCTGLTSFPLIDTTAITGLSNTWFGCSGLTSFPLIDTSAMTSLSSVWRLCSGLTSFPAINTSAATSITTLFRDCTSLICISTLDTSNATAGFSNFLNTPALVAPTGAEQTQLDTIPPGLNYVNGAPCP